MEYDLVYCMADKLSDIYADNLLKINKTSRGIERSDQIENLEKEFGEHVESLFSKDGACAIVLRNAGLQVIRPTLTAVYRRMREKIADAETKEEEKKAYEEEQEGHKVQTSGTPDWERMALRRRQRRRDLEKMYMNA